MFIWSVKLNRNLIWGLCAALCLTIGGLAVFTPKDAADVLKNNVDTAAKTSEQRVNFLRSFGYEVEAEPALIEEIIIPSDFDKEYEEYNNYQKMSGFDLSKHKGDRVKKYTYRVTNYPDSKADVNANLIVYKNKVIGGDVSAAESGGFVHGFIKE